MNYVAVRPSASPGAAVVHNSDVAAILYRLGPAASRTLTRVKAARRGQASGSLRFWPSNQTC